MEIADDAGVDDIPVCRDDDVAAKTLGNGGIDSNGSSAGPFCTRT
ncbi:hypothetical protein [Streptomyces sp. NPDC001820]